MTSIKDVVWRAIELSPSTRRELARGTINIRALAKAIKDDLGLEGTIDAVISAIRRYEKESSFADTFKKAINVVLGARLASKNGISSIMLDKSEDVVKILPKIFGAVELGQHRSLRIVHAQRSIKIYLDNETLPQVLELFPKNRIVKIEKGMGEVVIDLKPAVWDTPGVLALLSSELALNNVNIIETFTCVPEIVFIFREEMLMKAYEVLYSLARGDVVLAETRKKRKD